MGPFKGPPSYAIDNGIYSFYYCTIVYQTQFDC